jgi:hypothetical protein
MDYQSDELLQKVRLPASETGRGLNGAGVQIQSQEEEISRLREALEEAHKEIDAYRAALEHALHTILDSTTTQQGADHSSNDAAAAKSSGLKPSKSYGLGDDTKAPPSSSGTALGEDMSGTKGTPNK